VKENEKVWTGFAATSTTIICMGVEPCGLVEATAEGVSLGTEYHELTEPPPSKVPPPAKVIDGKPW
jgi:hypothetical protein